MQEAQAKLLPLRESLTHASIARLGRTKIDWIVYNLNYRGTIAACLRLIINKTGIHTAQAQAFSARSRDSFRNSAIATTKQ